MLFKTILGRRPAPATLLDRGAHRRPERGRTRTVLGTAVAIAATVAAGLQIGHATTTPNRSCHVSLKGVPRCGVLWGTVAGNNVAQTASLEKQLDRKFAIVYHFHGLDQTLPTRAEIQQANSGHFLRINLEARRFTSGHGPIRYADIIAGKFDAVLRKQAAGFKALHKPVYVSFDHEPDARSKYYVRGTPAQFRAAWRHIHHVYDNVGARNVAWVWTVTGWKGNWAKEDQMWPGWHYVAWVSWDPYNLAGCQDGHIDRNKWISFEQAMRDTYHHFASEPRMRHKPFMLSEFGTVTDYSQPAKVAQWYAAVPSTLKHYPRIKAVTQFNVRNDCDFRVDTNATIFRSYRSAGLKGYVNP